MEIIKLGQNSIVIEPIGTDSAICANSKELRHFESFSLYSVKFLILP